MRLQQITTLKFMDFSLTDIKNLLNKSNFDVIESLKIQSNALAEQAKKIEQAAKLIQYLVTELDAKYEVNWKNVAKIIEVMQMSETQKQQWYEKYLNPEELATFEKLHKRFSAKELSEYDSRWNDLLEEIRKNLHTDPEGATGQRLLKKWMTLVEMVYADHPELRNKIWEGIKAGIIPKEDSPCEQEIITYIMKAAEAF